MTNMPDEIVLASIMTVLDLDFKKALHYHDKGYDSDNDYGLPGPVMRPICIYLVSTIEASFTLQTTREHNVPPLPPHKGNPAMSCFSAKESANH